MLLASCTRSIADIAAHPKRQAGDDSRHLSFDLVNAILIMEHAEMAETVGVLSILDGAMLDEARRLWKLFETEYGSRGVQSFDHPNLTFQAGLSSDVSALTAALSCLSRDLHAFEIIVDGWGCFEVANVIFLNVVLTPELRHIHEVVYRKLQAHCVEPFAYYLPGQWHPHITVAMDDLGDADFCRAKQDLRAYHPRYQLILSNIHLVQLNRQSGRIEVIQSYALRR
jgi:2'-5' RNA ligase